jgi:hypothetical protein
MNDVIGNDNEPATKGELRSGLASVRGDIASLRDEFGSLRAEIREMFRPITITLANHTAELADIRGHLKDKMVTREEFHSRMDGFTGRVEDYDYLAAKNRERLDDHAKRIKALEDKAPQPPAAEA